MQWARCCSCGGARVGRALHVMDHSSIALAVCVPSGEGTAKHSVITVTITTLILWRKKMAYQLSLSTH